MGLMKSIGNWLLVHGESGNTKAINLSKYTDRVGEAGLSEILEDAKKLKLETVEELQRVTDSIITDDDPKLVEKAKLLRQRIDDIKWDIEHIVSTINRYSYMRSILPDTEAEYRRAVLSYDADVANSGNNACDRLSNVLRVKKDVQVLSDRVANRKVIMGKLEMMKSITILKRSITAERFYVIPYREERHKNICGKRRLNDTECVCTIVNASTLIDLARYDSISKSRHNRFDNQDELESYAASGKNTKSFL